MNKKILAGLGMAAVLALTACSGGGGDATQPGADGELTPVKVAVIPIGDTAAIWLGVDQGFFEDEGLDVTIDTAGGGAAIVPGVVSGDFDFGFSNYVSLYFANDKGLNLRAVANGVTAGEDLEKDFGGVVVSADSTIQTPADLAGKTVSVNTLANIGDTTVSEIVEADGGDSSTIDFIEVQFPDAPAALANGQIDAAWIVEPFLTQAIDAGARVVTYNFNGFDPELDVAGYFTSQKTLDAKPEIVKAFRAAMNTSLEYANDNPDEVRRILGTYTKIAPEVIERIALPRFRADVDLDAAEKLGDAAVKYSGLAKAPDFDSFFVLK
jgi:NitT/TauT family transport system substrate-binding protein